MGILRAEQPIGVLGEYAGQIQQSLAKQLGDELLACYVVRDSKAVIRVGFMMSWSPDAVARAAVRWQPTWQ